MADNIRRPARARMWKRIAIALASVSTAALVVFVILSFLPHGNAAFTIRIDNPYQKDQEESHFYVGMYQQNGGEEKLEPTDSLIKVDASLDHMVPTTAELVEQYLTEQNDPEHDKKLNQSQNWVTYKDASRKEIDRGLAQVYTVYLVNDSEEDFTLKYSVQADSYVDQEGILNYFRILIQQQTVGQDDVHNDYYGQAHNFPEETTTGAKNQSSEPISEYIRAYNTTVFTAAYLTNKTVDPETGKVDGDGYCNDFDILSENNKDLVKSTDIIIPAGKTKRFTYVAYFEGYDVDCHGSIPAGSYLLLSLNFGV